MPGALPNRLKAGQRALGTNRSGEDASALIIVMWIAFGLIALTLSFGQSMVFELRAADNRAAAIEAEQAIYGAARYITNVLARVTEPGLLPDTNSYRADDLQIGDARVWLIGRNDRQNYGANYAWGLVDEGSKLNLNVVTAEMLTNFPSMTLELAAAMIDWRDADEEVTENGAESETYMRRTPAYTAKNTNYESVAELHLVAGVTAEMLFGEDANLNGIVDLNENDAENAPPTDNRDSRLDPGLMEYFTVYTRVPTVGTNINDQAGLQTLMESKLDSSRVGQLTLRPQQPATNFTSMLEFYFASGMTREEMAKVEGFLVCTNATNALININTASEVVLACIPGIGLELAPQIIAYRQSNPPLNSIAWLGDALGWTAQANRANIQQVGPWICGRAFQLSADIAAVGHHGRGYKRVKYVFDVAEGSAQVRQRQDLTYLGWALGRTLRDTVLLASNPR